MAVTFDRLARSTEYSGWRALGELVLVFVFWIVLLLVLRGAFGAAGVERDSLADSIHGLLGLALLIPATLLGTRAVGRPTGMLLGVSGGIRGWWLVRCLIAAFVLVVAVTALQVGLAVAAGGPLLGPHDYWRGWTPFVSMLGIGVFVIPLQASGKRSAPGTGRAGSPW